MRPDHAIFDECKELWKINVGLTKGTQHPEFYAAGGIKANKSRAYEVNMNLLWETAICTP